MRKILTIKILLIIYSIILKANEPINNEKNFFLMKGNIGNIPITIYLYIDNNDKKISGKYYYNNIKQFINISGKLNDDNSFYIDEYINNNFNTGRFEGNISNFIFSGMWFSPSRENRFEFSFAISQDNTINKMRIISSTLTLKSDERANFTATKEALIIDNNKNIKEINKISMNINQLQSIEYSDISKKLKDSILESYNIWQEAQSQSRNFEVENNIKVSYIDNNIISFNIYDYAYTGGLHGIYTSIPYIYSIKTGDRIGRKISDLIENPYDLDLISLMRTKLLRSFSDNDFFDFYSIELSDIYDITPTGIKFIWPVYKIAGYSTGIIEIEFSFYELKPFIKKNSDFEYLFNN